MSNRKIIKLLKLKLVHVLCEPTNYYPVLLLTPNRRFSKSMISSHLLEVFLMEEVNLKSTSDYYSDNLVEMRLRMFEKL